MLNESLRRQYMEALGYSYDEKGIRQMQSDYFTRKADRDGVYGPNTDILLRNLYNFELSGIVKNFALHEFRCGCGSRYCTGYPAVVSQAQLKMVQAIRTHYGKPMTVTCGLRCSTYNKKLNGSIANSSHLIGYATDYYIQGVTDTLANRKTSIKWIKKQSNHAYSYGNGINSNGVKIDAKYMGNALHTDTKIVADVYPSIAPKNVNAQKIVDMCKQVCYPNGTDEKKWSYETGKPTDAYVKEYQEHTSRPHKKVSYSDCGYFTETIVKASGVDSTFKGLNFAEDYKKSKTLEVVHTGAIGSFKLQNGDIIEYKKTSGQHTVIIYDIEKNLIAEAGREARFDVIHKSTKYNASNVKKSTIRVIRAREGV